MEAVICDEDATLVNAGAWTGKTKTIESKIIYLHKYKNIPLDDILVVTFSKKSQQDMIHRILDTLYKSWIYLEEDDIKRHISTFHAFWFWIMKELLPNITNGKSVGSIHWWIKVLDEYEKDEYIQYVCEKLKKDSRIKPELIDFLLYYSAPQRRVEDFETKDEYYEQVKKDFKTMIKEELDTYYQTQIREKHYFVRVKSRWELIIANFLWSCNFNVKYEPKNHKIKDNRWNQIPYKPDFYLPDYNIYIEYFGVDEEGNTAPEIDAANYQDRMMSKIQKHKEAWTKFIDLRYADLQKGKDFLINKLEKNLHKYWVHIPEEKKSDLITELNIPLNDLEILLKNFLALYKESWESLDSLKEKATTVDPLNIKRNQIFCEIFALYLEIYTNYLNEWEEDWGKNIDFWDMIVEAKNLIQSGQIKRNYRYILVDEFQDISPARANLIKALIQSPLTTKLFCVWDDWQSIYKFAWSNTNLFFDFSKYFWFTQNIVLDQTFRFNQWISNVSGNFIMKNPRQTHKTLKALNLETNDKIQIFQNTDTDAETCYKQILIKILDHQLSQQKKTLNKHDKTLKISILYLTRYNLWKYLNHHPYSLISYLNQFFDTNGKNGVYTSVIFHNWRVFQVETTALTVHKSKGLEADYVITDFINENDALNFPSSLTDDPILDLVTDGEKSFLHAEERRVFYVAMTRGKKQVFLLYNKRKESSFLKDLLKQQSSSIKIISTSEDEISLLEDYNAPKCSLCWWKLMLSQYNKEKDIPEYYCKNYSMWCLGYYYVYNWTFYQYKNCPKPSCPGFLKIRKNGRDNSLFLGCSEYPNCRHTSHFPHAKYY